jgi:hypothetical protein
MYERSPRMRTYVVNAYWEGYNASIWITYTKGFKGSAHADVWERIPTPMFYPLLLTGIVLLIIGAISFVGSIIQVVRLSTKPKITLLLSGFLAPRILLLRSAVIDTSFVAIISSFWAFDYRQDPVGKWVLSKIIISAIPLNDSSISGFLFNIEYYLGLPGPLVLSILVIPEFILLIALWMFINDKIHSSFVKFLLIVNFTTVGILGYLTILLPSFSVVFVPLPLFALTGWYLANRWNDKKI